VVLKKGVLYKMANVAVGIVIILFIIAILLMGFYNTYYRWKLETRLFSSDPVLGRAYFIFAYIVLPLLVVITTIVSVKNQPKKERFCTEETCTL
jgi:hypothetical protein